MFTRFYEQSLYWFNFVVKPLKPMLERVKGGEPVVYGGLPIASFEKLLAGGFLQHVATTEYGWCWRYTEQTSLPENAGTFAEWRVAALAEATADVAERHLVKPCARDVLAEIAAFTLAAHTPIQAMNAIAGWQDYLRNREGAG
jgi:hypothetical protein